MVQCFLLGACLVYVLIDQISCSPSMVLQNCERNSTWSFWSYLFHFFFFLNMIDILHAQFSLLCTLSSEILINNVSCHARFWELQLSNSTPKPSPHTHPRARQSSIHFCCLISEALLLWYFLGWHDNIRWCCFGSNIAETSEIMSFL